MDVEMSDSKEDLKVSSILSRDTFIVKTLSSNILPLRPSTIESIVVVWLDTNADNSNDDYQNILSQLRTIVSTVHTYGDSDECIDFLTDIPNEKVFMVIANPSDKHIITSIHNIHHLDTIFVICDDAVEHQQTNTDWSKVKYLPRSTTAVCETFCRVISQCEQDCIAISFIEGNEQTTNQSLDQLEPSFMYTKIFKEIFLEMEYDQQAIDKFVEFWRQHYSENELQLKTIRAFETAYCSQKTIWWYTREYFIYAGLNQALRMLESDVILNMGFFLRDLHHEIERLHQTQSSRVKNKSFTLYRGQGLSVLDFEKLTKTTGGLISFNGFLSTSKRRGVAYMMAESNASKPETVSLTLTADNDEQLCSLTDHLRKETAGTTGLHRLALLLTKVGRYDKAEELCKVLIGQTCNQKENILNYNNLAYMKTREGDLDSSLSIYKQIIECFEQSPSLDHPILAASYNNIGAVYFAKEKCAEAISAFEKALEIRQRVSCSNSIDIAQSHNNIGALYDKKGEYLQALQFYEKALDIYRQNLPANHPDLATLYNNLGHVLDNLGKYSQVLLSYQKALEIVEKSLHSKHPDFAQSYNNIGLVHHHAGQYSQALSNYEKALKLRQQIFPPNHIDIGQSYINIGGAYDRNGQYSMALSYYDEAVVIFEQNHPSKCLELATLYNNICGVLGEIGQHRNAILYQEKALKLEEKILPSNHPSLATSYNNIGLVYYNLGNCSKAHEYYKKALEIREQILPVNHPDFAQSYMNIGGVLKQMKNYSQAVLFHEKAIEILKKTVPTNYPELVNAYNNTGLVYRNMNDYTKTLSYYKEALEIGKRCLPQNHPILGKTYANMGTAYYYTKSFSEAMLYLGQALDIFEKSLPPNHPDIQSVRRNIEAIQTKH
ncbi:unnamed protein product [Adineta ricciae]|uniref:UDP-N-acetylglucosamine--peptide N-acetylglucosaminyltransferase SPINDLY n=1 Tax=Adineta ricciae TaxID=249248 RepID=A0A814S0L6_ADIRI|nr:unnamed protein product [Adineta ricciae]